MAADLPLIPDHIYEKAGAVEPIVNSPNVSIREKLSVIYGFLDYFDEHYTAGLKSCKRGCSHCCYIDVGVTRSEAEFIAAGAGKSLKVNKPFRTHAGEKCTFLKSNGDCGVYAYRPYICRTYVVIDTNPDDCRLGSGKIVKQYGAVPNLGNHLLRDLYLALISWDSLGGGEMKDIRDWF